MHRFYADSPLSSDKPLVILSPEDSRHAVRVLRLRKNDPVELMTNGQRYSAVIEESDPSAVVLRKTGTLPSTEPNLKITLFQGLPKADKMEYIIQKSVEVGVCRIVPFLSSRCVVRWDARDSAKKIERWQRIAREAGKQSGRCVIPEILSPVQFHDICSFEQPPDACVVPWENAASRGPVSFMKDHPALSSLGIMIGPEGGLDESEIKSVSAVFEPLTLGPRILRTETAGLVAASAFLALSGEMENHAQ